MRNLIQLIVRYHAELLFLLLQIMCLNVLFSYSDFQKNVLLSSASGITSSWLSATHNVKSYFDLKSQNSALAKENTHLREMFYNSKRSESVANIFISSIDDSLNFELIPAEIINSTYNRQLNYFTLSVGSISGVAAGMGVLTKNGIVGVVTSVSDHFAVVLPLINKRFLASVEVKGKGYFGLMKWAGKNHKKAVIEDIATHAEIALGDTIITRGASALYPRNIVIGVVDEVQKTEGKNYLSIVVKLHTDFSKLRYVYVLKNSWKQEKSDLEAKQE